MCLPQEKNLLKCVPHQRALRIYHNGYTGTTDRNDDRKLGHHRNKESLQEGHEGYPVIKRHCVTCHFYLFQSLDRAKRDPCLVRQWVAIYRQFFRGVVTNSSRLNTSGTPHTITKKMFNRNLTTKPSLHPSFIMVRNTKATEIYLYNY